MNRLTKEDLAFISESTLPDKEIGEKLGRPYTAIRHARQYHNLPRKNKHISPDDIRFVIEHTPTMKDSEIAKVLKRSTEMISQIRAKTTFRKYRRFTQEETDWLKENYTRLGLQLCAEHLNHPQHSVYTKIKDLNASHPQRTRLNFEPDPLLTPNELAYLAGIVDGEGSIHLGFGWSKTGSLCIGPSITISNTSPELRDWLNQKLQHAKFQVSFTSNLPCYRCHIRYPYLKRLTELLLPFLVVKRRQAECLLKYLESRKNHARHPLTVNEVKLAMEMRQFNFHHKEGSITYQQYLRQDARLNHWLATHGEQAPSSP